MQGIAKGNSKKRENMLIVSIKRRKMEGKVKVYQESGEGTERWEERGVLSWTLPFLGITNFSILPYPNISLYMYIVHMNTYKPNPSLILYSCFPYPDISFLRYLFLSFFKHYEFKVLFFYLAFAFLMFDSFFDFL